MMTMRSLLLCLFVFAYIFVQAQATSVNASVNSSGWKRVAYSVGPQGRGFGKITVYTIGGAFTPYYSDIEWFKDWGAGAGVSIKSNSKSAYWTAARVTFVSDTTFIEVHFMRDVAQLRLLSDDYGYYPAQLIAGALPNGGGSVRAESSVGRFNLGEEFNVAFNGNVGIGTSAPSEKLAVNGTIRAKEIKVEATPWPDYVFTEDYQLPSLKETEQFIKINKHLPEVPSAKEVAGNGVALGEMNAILLKKVEELTLHLIEKDKQISILSEQKEDFDRLKEQVKELSDALSTLKRSL